MLCPDGSYVGRAGPNCEFKLCPEEVDTSVGQFCGGIAATMCPYGYVCKLDGNYPDAGGACAKEDSTDCIQVITPAQNPQTGEVREFPTPCDVPQGWIILN